MRHRNWRAAVLLVILFGISCLMWELPVYAVEGASMLPDVNGAICVSFDSAMVSGGGTAYVCGYDSAGKLVELQTMDIQSSLQTVIMQKTAQIAVIKAFFVQNETTMAPCCEAARTEYNEFTADYL